MQRRTFLRRSAAVAALGLAGCTGQSGGDSPTDAPTTTTGGMEPTGSVTTTAPAPETPTPTPTTTPTAGGVDDPPTTAPSPTPTASPTAGGTPTPAQTVVVGPNGEFSFSPASFTIAVGEAVRWTWDSSNHNVRPSTTPSGADWPGTPGGDGTTYDAGYTYRHTFDVAGSYEYFCAPHRSLGMTGSFAVE